MTNKVIGYIRTSTSSQDLGLEVQKKALERYKPDIIYSEKISGRKEKRIHAKQATDTRDISKMLSSLENEEAPSLAVLNNQVSINGKKTSHLDNVYVSLTDNNEPIYLYKQVFDGALDKFEQYFFTIAMFNYFFM